MLLFEPIRVFSLGGPEVEKHKGGHYEEFQTYCCLSPSLPPDRWKHRTLPLHHANPKGDQVEWLLILKYACDLSNTTQDTVPDLPSSTLVFRIAWPL